MKEKFIPNLSKINPTKNGLPENNGNCQWCAIQGLRVLFGKDSVPTKVLGSKKDQMDPIEEYIHPTYDYKTVYSKTRQNFFESLGDELQSGEAMLVSLEGQIDHAYIIYREKDTYHLIDPDRNIFVELKSGNDFIQKVAGWTTENEVIDSIDYSNGNKNPGKSSEDDVKMIITIINHASVAEHDLPKYSEEPTPPRSTTECRIL